MKKYKTLGIVSIVLVVMVFALTQKQNLPEKVDNIPKPKYTSSKGISVNFPEGYSAKEIKNMLIISNEKGAIVIGGFHPADGRPDAYVKGIMGQEIWYNKDKTEPGSLPSAVYYRPGDNKTKEDLLNILKSIAVN